MLNKLLLRQVQKHFGNPDDIPEEFNALLKVVSEAYDHYEKDRNMLERSIELSSNEMIGLNDQLRKETAEVKIAHYNLKTLFENIQEVFFSVEVIFENGEIHFKTLQVSPGCVKVYGYQAEDFFRNANLWRDLVIEEDKIIIREQLPLLLHGEPIVHEYRIRQKEGSVRWIETKITPTLDESGKLIRIDGVTSDINEKKSSEKKLEEAQQKLEEANRELNKLFNNIDEVMYSVDMVAYKLIQMSAGCKKVYGYTPEQFLANDNLWKEVIHPDDLHIPEDQVQVLHKGQQVFNQYRIIHRDGSIRWIENIVIPTLDENGRLIRLDGLTKDITTQRNNAQKLQESEVRFRSLIENSADMLTMSDKEGNVLYESPSVTKTMGYIDGENIGRSSFEIIHPDDREKCLEAFSAILENPGIPVPLVARLKTKNNGYIFAEGDVTNLLHVQGINAIVSNFRDVTTRVEAERHLDESRKRYRLVYENPFLGIALGSIEGRLQNVNQAFCNMLGYSERELRGRHFSEFTYADDVAKELQFISKMKAGEIDNYQLEKRYITKTGKLIRVELSISCAKNESGEIQFVVAMVRDITAGKKAEESLQKSEANLRNILENTDTAYVLLDVNARILSFNNLAQELARSEMGESLEEGKNYIDLMHEERKEDVRKNIKHVLEQKEQIRFEIKYSHTDKPERWLWVSMHPIFDRNAKVLGLSIAATDITNRKTSEHLIKLSNERYELVTKATNDVIWDWDILNNKIYRSENYKQIFGYQDSEENIYTHSADTNIHPEDAQRILDSIDNMIRNSSDSLWEDEYRYYRNNGEMAYIKDRGYIIYDEHKKPVRMVGAMSDITTEKLYAIERDKITSDIIRQNKDLEQFAYIVSHNLRAPLANIVGLLGIIRNEKLDTQTRRISMDGLTSSVQKLDDVIMDLGLILNVKREINEKKEIVRFSELVEDIKLSVNSTLEQEEVIIHTDFSETDEIFSLKSYLHSIFYNLISNSIKYRKPAEKPVIRISSGKIGNKIVLHFNDNGRGIDLGMYSDKVFGLYKRFHYNVEGKGMGLFMVKTQVETLGGKINVKSGVNLGTEFTIEFENQTIPLSPSCSLESNRLSHNQSQ